MVKKLFSKAWISSTQTRKQRKYQKNAPLHIKHKFMAAPLSKGLREQYGFRSIPLRKDDEVEVTTGQFKGVKGKVTKVSLAQGFVHVDGATLSRKDGSNAQYPIHPSNVKIVKLDLSDKLRAQKVEIFTVFRSKIDFSEKVF